ncbi:hypothetical protein [Cronbergia sp. UHCC 0137]
MKIIPAGVSGLPASHQRNQSTPKA